MSSSSTRRQQQERDNEYISNIQQQHEATIHSIDMTKDNIRRSIEEVRRETPRYSQTVTDFQNETADASVEIADNFLESQKEVINSMQYAWAPMAERIGQVAHYWTTSMTPFFSPREMADIYARTIGAMAEAYVASTRMATNMMFAGMEASKASTNYARQNAKEVSRITSNTARNFSQAAKETVQVQEGEDEQRGREGGISAGGSSRRLGTGGGGAAAQGSTAGSFESKGGGAATTTTTRTTYTSEGTIGNSGTGTDSAATTGTTGGTVSLSDTVPGLTGKTGKKF
ncbi:MAG: hypothetical protein M3M91_01585 [Thermoproteota archaeon]|nr:hypothetical protein [Thermoproteota archaeon]